MDGAEIQNLCLDLLNNSWPAYLTTIDEDGYPQTRAMFNLRNKERFPHLKSFFEKEGDFTIIFSTNTSSTKIEDISRKSAASVYYCDPDTWRGVMFGGDIEIVKDDSIKKDLWHDDWVRYYPKGYNDPDHTVLRMRPVTAKGWTGSMTFRLELGDEK